jgi:hypothetical protein
MLKTFNEFLYQAPGYATEKDSLSSTGRWRQRLVLHFSQATKSTSAQKDVRCLGCLSDGKSSQYVLNTDTGWLFNDVIVSACKSDVYRIANNVQEMDKFWLKGLPDSLYHMCR